MIEYVKGTKKDYEEIVDLANYIFSQDSSPHDFTKLIPKLYKEAKDTEQYHYLIKEGGKIRAMVCSYPVELNILGHSMRTRGIGTVAVHPRARGKGYMQELMKWAVEDMQKDGTVLSVLCGQRQRYEYFGYEPCGIQINFTASQMNIAHRYPLTTTEGIKINRVNSMDQQMLEKVHSLHQAQQLYGVRSKEEFYDICATWESKLYSIRQEEQVIGYFIISSGAISELVLADHQSMIEIIKAILSELGRNEIGITVPMHDVQHIKILEDLCEGYSIGCNKSILVLDYISIIGALMQLKQQTVFMPDGEVTLEIKEYGKIKIAIEEGKVNVCQWDGEVDLKLSRLKATAWLFSPMKAIFDFDMKAPEVAKLWFPLPLYIPSIDTV